MKKERNLYKIGELAKLCRVTVRTLQIYDEKGLLVPGYVADSGHRYYNSENVLRLCFINSLKELGLSLWEIQEMFADGVSNMDIVLLERLLQKSQEEIIRLNKRCYSLNSLIADYKKKEGTTEIYLDKFPSVIVAYHTMMVSDHDDLDRQVMEVAVPEMLRLGCVIPHPYYCFSRETGRVSADGKFEVEFCDEVLEQGEDSDLIRFKQLPEVPLAVCMKVYGPHNQLETSRIRLLAEIARRGYRIVDAPRYNYVDGAWNQKNPEKWLTIIQVPVEAENVQSNIL